MNPRIKELAEQAGYFIRFERTGQDVTVVHTKEPGNDGDLALFAKLIQRDTIQCLRDMFEENSTNWLVLNALIETGFKE